MEDKLPQKHNAYLIQEALDNTDSVGQEHQIKIVLNAVKFRSYVELIDVIMEHSD